MSALRPRMLLGAAAASATASVAVGVIERGVDHFNAPLHPYLGDVTLVGSGFSFLRSFVTDLPIYSAPVRHHPPGFLLGLWVLDWLHLHGPGWATAVVVIVAALVAPALLAIVRDLTGGAVPWWAAGAAVVGPAVLWPAPQPVGLFAGVTALAVALLVCSPSLTATIAGGVALGAALLLMYEALFVAIIPVGILVMHRRVRALALAVGACIVVLVAFDVAGFTWLAGFRARW